MTTAIIRISISSLAGMIRGMTEEKWIKLMRNICPKNVSFDKFNGNVELILCSWDDEY